MNTIRESHPLGAICKHGHLARKCEHCEFDAVLKICAEQVARLRALAEKYPEAAAELREIAEAIEF